MPFLKSKDASIFYTDDGPSTAQPILLIHGWTCDSHDWMFQTPFLLSEGYRVIAPDLRGHGASTAPRDSEFFGAIFADDMLSLLQHLAVPRAILMGHSMGAKEVASTLATRNPEVVEALIFIDVVYNEIQDRVALANVIQMFQTENASAIAAAGMVSDQFNPASTPAWLKTWHSRRKLATPSWVVGGCFRDHHVDGDIGANPEHAAKFMKKRKAPWLYVERNEEGADILRAYEKREGDEIKVMAGTGHWLQQEKWQEFNALVLEWLQKRGLVP